MTYYELQFKKIYLIAIFKIYVLLF